MKYLIILSIILFANTALSFDHQHSAFTKLLQAHVKVSKDQTSSSVDYKNFNKDDLNKYLSTVSGLTKEDFSKFSNKEKLAFYINTYNAYTIKLILNNYPVSSIKKTVSFFSNPWKKEFFKLFGQDAYLDKIEHKLVRDSKNLGADARIHFAFNCASIGCPALLNEAWTADKLETQLDTAAKNFLKDHSRNRVNLKKKRVELSNIFKWYGDDFKTRNYKSLKVFLTKYKNSISKNNEEEALIDSENYSISYTGYDWNLNDSRK